MENEYGIMGKVSIPKEKRTEFNENVLKIFKSCGIRKTENIKLAGKMVTVVHTPEPDANGIVEFDYSVFEMFKKKTSYYDMNTCELHVTDQGYGALGAIVNMIMVMQDAYSSEHCFFMHDQKIERVEGYAYMIEETTGIILSFPNRQKVWDMLLFLKSHNRHDEINLDEILDIVPSHFCNIDIEELKTCLICSSSSVQEPKEWFDRKKENIKYISTDQRTFYAYELFQKLIKSKGKKEIDKFLKELLDSQISDRECLSQHEDEWGILAEISLYDLPGCIVTAYGWAAKEKFWDLWFSLGINGYKDINRIQDLNNKETANEPSENSTEREERDFYKNILRNNEDEFLEFWDDQELYLSDSMKKNLRKWKHLYEKADEVCAAKISIEIFLADILSEMQNIWKCRYADKKLINEFMANSNDIRYRKALLVFRQILDMYSGDFPELTASQEKEWVIKKYVKKADRLQISGYASLLINNSRRAKLLGF